MAIRRGDIYYISIPQSTGHEMIKDRPGVVVSCDALNATSPCVQVVYLSGSLKRALPEHVAIRSSPQRSTALCEQIYTVDKSRLGRYLGAVTGDELARIDGGIMLGLSLGGRGEAI